MAFSLPKSVIAFTEKYKAQNDQYRDFFVEYIIKDPEATEPIQMPTGSSRRSPSPTSGPS